MKKFLNDSYRRSFDNKIKNIVVSHKNAFSSLKNHKPLPDLKSIENDVGFTENDASAIYKYKCEENEISPNDIGEEKFVHSFLNSIRTRSLLFSGLGMGPKCIAAFTKILANRSNFLLLDLSLNRIQEKGALILAEFLSKDPPIIYLDLRSNSLNPTSCSYICRGLKKNNHLSFLDFSAIDGINRNRIGLEGCKNISNLMILNQVLTHLNISLCGISSDGCLILHSILNKDSCLISLNISGNNFGSQGVANLLCDSGQMAILENLDLSNNDIMDSSSTLICKRFSESFPLQVINLSGNHLGLSFIKHFYQILQQDNQIRVVDISRNEFDSRCAEYIHLILLMESHVTNLDISHNPLEDDAIITIAKALPNNISLMMLNLSDTLMGNDGACAIASAISNNKYIQSLYLENNTISDIGGINLAKALASNQNITNFSMKSNELNDDSGKAFLEMLHTNKTITEIDLSLNNFSYILYQQLSLSMKDHSRTIHDNITQFAAKHIEKLETNEEQYSELIEEIEKEEKAYQDALILKEQKLALLNEIKNRRVAEKANHVEIIKTLKAEHEQIDVLQRKTTISMADLKVETDEMIKKATTEYQEFANKKFHAESHMKRNEAIKFELMNAKERILNDMRAHFSFLKEQLVTIINEAQETKKRVLAEEELKNKEKESVNDIPKEPESVDETKKKKRKKQ